MPMKETRKQWSDGLKTLNEIIFNSLNLLDKLLSVRERKQVLSDTKVLQVMYNQHRAIQMVSVDRELGDKLSLS